MTIELKVDERIGDYQLLKRMGKDVIGSIFLAEHYYLKKTCALRIFSSEWTESSKWEEAFERSLSQYVRVEHPAIVELYNAGKAQGKYFVANECVVSDTGEPQNLTQALRLANISQTKDELYDIILTIAQGIEAIHSIVVDDQPLVHGSLTPSAVLIMPKNQKTIIKIQDMGLAKLCGPLEFLSKNIQGMLSLSSSKSTDTLSNEELSFFNEFYSCLAPEVRCSPNQISTASDVYALGVVSYFLLSGTLPQGVDATNIRLDYELQPLISFARECMNTNPLKRPQYPTQRLIELLEQKPIDFQRSDALLKPILSKSVLERPSIDHDPAAQFSHQPVVSQYKPEKHDITEVEPLLNDMVIIEGGQFYRGCDSSARDERPRHQILLDSFAIDVSSVTNDQYVRFLEAMGGEKDANHNDLILLRESRIKKVAGQLSIEAGYNHHPVVGVTWYGAFAYCKWVGKRLPTEAEWEIAAKGGTLDAPYPTGQSIEKSKANFFNSDTVRVKSYPANGYGLYDMAGNVYEWCQDWYGYNYYEVSQQEPNCPRGPLQGVYRVLRGGCWKSLELDLLCTQRHRNKPGISNSTYGFRCASDVKIGQE